MPKNNIKKMLMGYKFMDGTLIEGSQWAQIKVVLFIDYNVAFTFIYFSHVNSYLELKGQLWNIST